MAAKEPIGVIGVGWVGLCTAACFADLGHHVYARDIVPEKVASLARGDVPMHEPGLPELVERNAERLTFTTDMREVLDNAELLFCCVDTPPTYSGDADLSRVEAVIRELGDSTDHAIIMKSTVPVGTGRSIQRRREDLGYVSNPEFLKEGTAVSDFLSPDRVVVGANDGSGTFADRVAALYEPLDAPIVRTDVASAEMIKLASNAFLATKISFINEIANVSEELGADVNEVARGMGLDERIGSKFLQAGIGYGGSCLVGDETVLVRRSGRIWSWTLEEMFARLAEEDDFDADEVEVVYPRDLEVLSWREGRRAPEFLPVGVATRRHHDGEVVQVRTKMGRRVSCTIDHPFVVANGSGTDLRRKLALDLTEDDWLPIAMDFPAVDPGTLDLDPLAATLDSGLSPCDILVRPGREVMKALATTAPERRAGVLEHPRGANARFHDIVRTGAMRLDEALAADLTLKGASAATVRNGAWTPFELEMREPFWRVVGLYIAEGHQSVDAESNSRRLCWSFHPTKEPELVQEVVDYWSGVGVKVTAFDAATSRSVRVSSRLLADWWVGGLGMGRNSYEQRIPDLAWSQPESHREALLAGLWCGDGSWSYVSGGPSVVLEYGTISRELADGVHRLLNGLGFVASMRVGRTRKSTADTYWLRVSGADQVDRLLDLVPQAAQGPIRESLGRQSKRIAPTGYRRHSNNAAWARFAGAERRPFKGSVYSVEVPGAHTFVTTYGLVVHNCFPKDVSALKQLAGNSGYAFQLLTAVIEVNELQKRRTVSKLQKHLGSLVNKEIALLGVAFKPDTDDVREAASLVLAARLQGEGANVRVYDPVAAGNASEMLGGATICGSALEALDGADAAVLVTEWGEFAELDWAGEVKERMATPLVVDGRNFLDREGLRAAGFAYEGIGR